MSYHWNAFLSYWNVFLFCYLLFVSGKDFEKKNVRKFKIMQFSKNEHDLNSDQLQGHTSGRVSE